MFDMENLLAPEFAQKRTHFVRLQYFFEVHNGPILVASLSGCKTLESLALAIGRWAQLP